jgi:hypothetical protein
MIIQTIRLPPSGAVRTDDPSNVSSLDPSGAYWFDAEHPARKREVAYLVFGRLLLGLAHLAVRGRINR